MLERPYFLLRSVIGMTRMTHLYFSTHRFSSIFVSLFVLIIVNMENISRLLSLLIGGFFLLKGCLPLKTNA